MREYSSPHRQKVIQSLRELISEVEKFQPQVSLSDRAWSLPLKIGNSWRQLEMSEYQGTFYLSVRGSFQCSYTVATGKVEGRLRLPDRILLEETRLSVSQTQKRVASDPIEYHKELVRSLSPALRFGTIPREFCKILLPEWNRFDKELSREEITKALELLQTNTPQAIPNLTANTFFESCRIAYLANSRSLNLSSEELSSATGRELYSRFADGRDGGLLTISPDSAEAFKRWFVERTPGSHPWEIYRGGNATHIDLGVRSLNGEGAGEFCLYLCAFSSSRLVETCRIALALSAAGIPCEWLHKESYIDRLRGDDNVGIVPNDHPLTYGHHNFPSELRVSDCIHYEMLRDYNTGKPLASWATIKGIVNWMPIRPILLSNDGLVLPERMLTEDRPSDS